MWPPSLPDENEEPFEPSLPPGVVRIIEDGDYERRAWRRAPGVKAARQCWDSILASVSEYARTLKWGAS